MSNGRVFATQLVAPQHAIFTEQHSLMWDTICGSLVAFQVRSWQQEVQPIALTSLWATETRNTLCFSLLFLLRDKSGKKIHVSYFFHSYLDWGGKKPTWTPAYTPPNKLTKAPRNGLPLTWRAWYENISYLPRTLKCWLTLIFKHLQLSLPYAALSQAEEGKCISEGKR